MTVQKTLWRTALTLAVVLALGPASTSMAIGQSGGQAPKAPRKPLRVVWVHAPSSPPASRPEVVSLPLVMPGRAAVSGAATTASPPSSQQIIVEPAAEPATTSLRGVQEYLGLQNEPAPGPTLKAPEQRGFADRVQLRRSTPPRPRQGDGTYVLGAGDVLDIFVWRNAELSRQVPVRPDGYISLPLAGELVATGKTVRQLQDEITAVLAEYVQVPTVTVTITEIRSLVIYVLGSVAKPGPVQLDRQVTPLQAIAMAGGLTEFADKNGITILRTINGRQQRIDFRYGDFVKGKGPAGEILLRAGDVVYVP